MARQGWLVGLVVCSCVAACGGRHATHGAGAPSARQTPGLARTFQRILDQQRRLHGLPGVAAAVVIPGRGVWSGGSGLADRARRKPVGATTPFPVASVTKLMIAALVVKLAEQGRLRLEDHVSRWLPRWPYADRITVRQLLNQTSGVTEPPARLRRVVSSHPRSVWPTAGTVLGLQGRDPVSGPGVVWRYNNLNYGLAGVVIERATHHTAAYELRQLLLDPLHLDDVVLEPQESPPQDTAHAYAASGTGSQTADLSIGSRLRPSNSLASALWTAGGMVASAPSLARLGDALLRGSLLAADSRAQVLTTVAADGMMYASYGLGIGQNLSARLSTMVWVVYGNLPGVGSTLAFEPDRKITAVVLTNSDQTEVTADIADNLLHAAAGSTGSASANVPPRQKKPEVDQIEARRRELVNQDIMLADVDIALCPRSQHGDVKVGGDHRTVGAHPLAEPVLDRSAAGGDCQASPSVSGAAGLELTDRPRIEGVLQRTQPPL